MGKLGATIAKYYVRPTIFVALAGFALPASSDENVRYLKYENCGAYTVSRVMLNYKNANMTEHQSFKIGITVKGTYKLLSDPGAVCVDLTDDRYGDIDDGAEVWLSVNIESGDNESCKKDTRRIKDSESKKWNYSKRRGKHRPTTGVKLLLSILARAQINAQLSRIPIAEPVLKPSAADRTPTETIGTRKAARKARPAIDA